MQLSLKFELECGARPLGPSASTLSSDSTYLAESKNFPFKAHPLASESLVRASEEPRRAIAKMVYFDLDTTTGGDPDRKRADLTSTIPVDAYSGHFRLRSSASSFRLVTFVFRGRKAGLSLRFSF
jgi:hypothetical protein